MFVVSIYSASSTGNVSDRSMESIAEHSVETVWEHICVVVHSHYRHSIPLHVLYEPAIT